MDSENLSKAVNGLIWPGFLGETVPDWLHEALEQGLAGVVYFSHNITSAEQVAQLSARIHQISPEAIIGADEEGGTVTRLPATADTLLPTAAVLGRIDDPTATEAAGAVLARLCRRSGVDLNLAPVADVNTAPGNPVIGVRSFGADQTLAARHTTAMIRGMQNGRPSTLACAKHFPGHGDTVTDSHRELPRVTVPLSEFIEQHLPPFQAAAEAGVAAMMSAHIVVPELGDLPATLNPRAVALLRNTGFDGVLITDALDMAAVRDTMGSGEGAVQAILAGADLLCVGNPSNSDYAGGPAEPGQDEREYAEIRDALLAAVRDGRISETRIIEAHRRLRKLRSQRTAAVEETAELPSQAPDWLALTMQACTGRAKLPDAVRQRSSIVIEDIRESPNLAAGALPNFFAIALAEHFKISSAQTPDLVLADALHPGSSQYTRLAELAEAHPDLVCINAGLEPQGAMPLPVLTCFGASLLSAQAAIRIILDAHDADNDADTADRVS